VEIAYFIMVAVGTFVSVISLAAAVFKHWRKKQDEQFELFRESMDKMVREERRTAGTRSSTCGTASRRSSPGKDRWERSSRDG